MSCWQKAAVPGGTEAAVGRSVVDSGHAMGRRVGVGAWVTSAGFAPERHLRAGWPHGRWAMLKIAVEQWGCRVHGRACSVACTRPCNNATPVASRKSSVLARI